MPAIAIALPILPGKEEAWRRWMQELQGSRRGEYAESRRRLGITRELYWLQRTHAGGVVVRYVEGAHLATVYGETASPTSDFDHWMRARERELYGTGAPDTQPQTALELVAEWAASGAPSIG